MIFLAFLVPLAVYLIVLGFINRRRTPLMVPGLWDCWGLLFAASGFLLLGGPAILSGLHENWRRWWIFGPPGGRLFLPADQGSVWVLLAALYFLGIVGLVAWQLWRARHLTSIYNVEADAVTAALADAAERLSLNLAHSGALYAFSPDVPLPEGSEGSAEEPPSHAVTAGKSAPGSTITGKPGRVSVGQTAVLEVDSFPLLRHVTLRWHPGGSLVRRQVEEELARLFRLTPTPEHEVGGWLQVLGLGLLSFASLGCVTLQILNYVFGR